MSTSTHLASRIGFLFKPPKKWTAEHIRAVNLKESGPFPPGDIVGESNLPNDSDPTFTDLAHTFMEPNKEEIRDSRWIQNHHDTNIFADIFEQVWRICMTEGEAIIYGAYLWVIMLDLDRICDLRSRGLGFNTFCSVPFTISSLNIKGNLNCDGIISRWGPEGPLTPLTICTNRQTSDEEIKTKSEIPYALFLLVIAFDEDPSRESYTSFVIILRRTFFQITKAVASKFYLQSLVQGEPLTENLEIYRSETYDLVDPWERKGFLRIFLGLIRYLETNAIGILSIS